MFLLFKRYYDNLNYRTSFTLADCSIQAIVNLHYLLYYNNPDSDHSYIPDYIFNVALNAIMSIILSNKLFIYPGLTAHFISVLKTELWIQT